MIASLIAALGVAHAPEASPIPTNPCKPPEACRYVADVTLRDQQGVPRQMQVRRWLPFLTGGRLVLFPGEVVTVKVGRNQVQVLEGGVVDASDRDAASEARLAQGQRKAEQSGREGYVGAPIAPSTVFDAPSDTLRIGFVQVGASSDMMLRVSSGYGQTLTYKAALVSSGRRNPAPTTVCPVTRTRVGLEGWPGPLLQIVLSDFTLTDAAADVGLKDCR